MGARTAEFCSKHGNTDITELVDLDKATQCEKRTENNAEGKSFCTCGIILQRLSAKTTKTLKEKTAQEMIRLTVLLWKIRTRGLSRLIGQTSQDHQTATHHFPRALGGGWFRKFVQLEGIQTQTVESVCKKNSRTYETIASWDKVAS